MEKQLKARIRTLANELYDVQKLRIQTDNRLTAMESFYAADGSVELRNAIEVFRVDISTPLNELEERAAGRLGDAIEGVRVYEWLKLIRGIGPRLAGSLVGFLPDAENLANVSKLWAYTGFSVIPVCSNPKCEKIAYSGEERIKFLINQSERRWKLHQLRKEKENDDEEAFRYKWYEKSAQYVCNCVDPEVTMRAPRKAYFTGLLLIYNPIAKSLCWKIMNQFIKQGKFYREHFDLMMARYKGRHEGEKRPIVILRMASRATVKLFLSHYWEMLRKSEGMPAGAFYLKRKLELEGRSFDEHSYIAPPYADLFVK